MTTPTMPLDCDGFAEALGDYLEGDAPDGLRLAVESHAGSCAACRQLLTDLGAVSAAAAALPLLAPSRDLWSGIAERIDARVIPLESPRAAREATRRGSWARPAVAAAALVLITAGVTYVATRASLTNTPAQPIASANTDTPATPIVVADTATATGPTAEIASLVTERPVGAQLVSRTVPLAPNASAEVAMSHADSIFAGEISKLRMMVRLRRSKLDPSTVAVLDQSIAVIDSAIAQSRAALAKDPASGFLATQLNHSLEKKVELLRTAALLPSRT